MLRNVRALLESNLAVLDVRSLAEHERRRISGSVCIPWTDINNRFCELPDKCVSFALLAPPEECAAIATRLRGRGFAVASALEDSDELWAALARESPGHVLTDPPTSRGRLWRPSRFVEVAAPLVLRALADRGPVPPALFSLTGADFDAATTAPVSTGPDGELTLGDGAVVGARVSFLDVACGSGRDSVWLASVFSRASGSEWRGVAVDINKRAVERARAFLGRAGAPGAVAFGAMDTEADFPSSVAPAVTALAESAGAAVPFDVVLCVRYLHRPLLPCLASLVRPGGFILYQTFLEGASHPREPRHLLRRGELASLYGVLGFDAVVDCEGRIADGRPMSYYVGRRRGEG